MRTPLIALLLPVVVFAGERINQEGRILGPTPVVSTPTLFNTAAADAIVSAMQIMPVDNPWNEDVSRLPVLSNSAAMIAQIQSDIAAKGSGRQNLRLFTEMNYVLVPDAQPLVAINFFNYPDQSDYNGGTSPNGLYPIPSNLPIEEWPAGTGSLTLSQWQQDDDGSDRHSIMVMPGSGNYWETWETLLSGSAWQASNGAQFNLNSDALRTAGWTSGDAAGLQMFPALVRYDECQRGMVEHAMRLVVAHSRLGPVYPATHDASTPATNNANVPAMGQRLRLKSSFVIPSNYSTQEKAVLLAMKKYGMIVADNGGFFSVSITPDDRWGNQLNNILNSVPISNFEVVQSTGQTQGPRSAGAPTANAGSDQWIPIGSTAQLNGSVTFTSAATIGWKLYSGPAAVTFGNATQAATTATFPIPGTYTLMLSATDGIHAVAYDAVVINVTLTPTLTPSGNDMHVIFPSTSGHLYRVQNSSDLVHWSTLSDNIPGTGSNISITHSGAFSNAWQFYQVLVLN